MIRLQVVTSSLLFLLISVSNVTGDALPNRLPLYQCHPRNNAPQSPQSPPLPRKPHIFVYVEDRAFKNIAQQVRHHPRKYSNYEITKSEVPYPIGSSGCEQEVLRVMNRYRLNNDDDIPQLPTIPTQIPSPLEEASNDKRDAESSDKSEESDKVPESNKDSILVQIPINKYFDCKNTEILIKIAKKEEAEAKPATKQPVVCCKPPVVQAYNANIEKKLSKLKVNVNGDGTFQKLCMTPRPVQPASSLNTEIQADKSRPEPRIVELPISFADFEPSQLSTKDELQPQYMVLPHEILGPSQSPTKDEPQPQYMVLPPGALGPAYANHQTIAAPEDHIKNIVFSEGGRQQNTPETCSPVGYTDDQNSMLKLNELEQADLNACHHANNNVPIKDINIEDFESFVEQDQEGNQEKCEKCSNKPEASETGVEKTSKETKKNNNRPKSKGGKQYGLIVSAAEPESKM